MIPKYNLPNSNRIAILARRPEGVPIRTDFRIVTEPRPEVGADKFLVRNLYLSADPVQRGWAANPDVMPVGSMMKALAVGVIVASRCDGFNEGELVYGHLGWQDYAVVGPDALLSHTGCPRAPAACYAGVLGMPGATAWLALSQIAPPQAGQSILVSTAAGAVGSVVGQIARAAGAHVVGLTGSEEKAARCVSRFGYSAAYNYKNSELAEVFADAAPGGFQTYFDNTGGIILDHAIRAMARHGRIIQCGTAATAIWSPPPTGWRPEREILTRVLTWAGFNIFDSAGRFGEAIEALSLLLERGQLNFDLDVEIGFGAIVSSLEKLFDGTNVGKMLVYIGED
jgi:NADPH-dependent curcumin reductase CurA